MAWLNIRENAWKKFYEVAELMDWDMKEAFASIGCLWHESQSKFVVAAPREQILRWSKIKDPTEGDRYIDALLEVGVLRVLTPAQEYEICGNDEEIAQIVSTKEKAKKGGEATRRKWQLEKKRISGLQEGSKPSTSQPEPMPEVGLDQARTRLNSIQCNSTQSNSIQENTFVDSGEPTELIEPDVEVEPPKPKPPKFDFELIYHEYPRKEGKAAGIASCRTQIKTFDDFEALTKAVAKYRDLCEREGTEKQFIKLFSTFMGSAKKPTWRDYLDDDVGSSTVQAGVKKHDYSYLEDVP